MSKVTCPLFLDLHMFKRGVCILVFCTLYTAVWGQQAPKMRRICRDFNSTNNLVFFFPGADTCNSFVKYYIYARNGDSGPFFILDSIDVQTVAEYTHVNANPGAPTVWFYFLEYVDSCFGGPDLFSDTLSVDITAPDTLLIDSVSIDIASNTVQVGWKSNSSPDFFNYILFRIDASGIYTNLTGAGTRDTFWIDNTINPKNEAYLYDLLSRDSCTNPQIFGINQHRPILLRSTIDTCLNRVNLNWSNYVGWSVRRYYLYQDSGGTGYQLIDSFDQTIRSYTKPVTLGINYRYFIRAFADTNYVLSSSSNEVEFSTRLRIDPEVVWLQNVSFSNTGSTPIFLRIDIPGTADVSKIAIHAILEDGDVSVDTVYAPIDFPFQYVTTQSGAETIKYVVSVYGLCGFVGGLSDTLNCVLLSQTIKGNVVELSWNRGPGWLSGVESYTVMRGIVGEDGSVVYTDLKTLDSSVQMYVDSFGIDLAGPLGINYLIRSQQLPGSPWVFTSESFSNHVNASGQLRVYIPNAFVPNGLNSHFRPEGMFIDYTRSELVIYNRWGESVIHLQGLTPGWDGRDRSGITCAVGVYLYEMIIFDLNGKSVKKTGTVTLLN